jgi:hypothetical protein
MKWKRIFAGLTAIGLLFFFLVYFNPPVTFHDLKQASNELKDAGFICTSDRADGKSINGFIVSRKAIPWEDSNSMWKAGPMGSDWKGKVWISKHSSEMPLETTPNDQAPRIWGNVLAFGDQEFLDEIEGALKRTRRFGWL